MKNTVNLKRLHSPRKATRFADFDEAGPEQLLSSGIHIDLYDYTPASSYCILKFVVFKVPE